MGKEDRLDAARTIPDLLRMHAELRPDAPAILGDGAAPLTYGRLWQAVGQVVAGLRALGVTPADRLALALPNGPEMALALAAVPCAAACVPLNPAFTGSEWRRYFADLEVSALLALPGDAGAARSAAVELGLAVIDLQPWPGHAAGLFRLTGAVATAPAAEVAPGPDDTAFVLPTSGTTARPKPVPLSHRNLCVSAGNTAAWLRLAESDRLLGVLPLFHAHGLISGLYTTLAAGASVVCTGGFVAPRFLAWLRDWQPTWYTAVPTIHQAVLQRVALQGGVVEGHGLRLIRSASAPLSPRVLRDLERIFGVPVIETYGMTEATSQIASNPLPPHPRKPGSVGLAAGPEVAVMDPEGRLLPAGGRGELVLRGASVTAGYGGGAAATAALRNGWFRTGDLGFLDDEGYIFIVGRRKEMINRGGQSIAPREIEEAIGEHPAVLEVAAFAVADVRLGEVAAAAVVLREGTVASADELRRFAAERLAVYKVPQQLDIVEAIPKGPTGKLSRSLLSSSFVPAARADCAPRGAAGGRAPRSQTERVLLALCGELLELDTIGLDDDFFALGGDSLLATRLMARVRARLGRELSHFDIFDAPSVAGLSARLERTGGGGAAREEDAIAPVSRARPIALSFPQQRLYFLQRRTPSTHAYHLVNLLHLNGTLDRQVLARTLAMLVERHEALRTTYSEDDGVPVQSVGPAFRPALPLETLDGGSLARCLPQIESLARRELATPFDLARGPLLRARLLQLGAREHVLLLTLHHIATDGWSQRILWREFGEIYGALTQRRAPRLPPARLHYSDVAAWQERRIAAGRCTAQLAYWQALLTGAPLLELPLDRPRPPDWSFRGARRALVVPMDLVRRLKAAGARSAVTLYMLVLAAWSLLLQRYARASDIVVGTLLSGRERVEMEGIIGFFVNTVALRIDLSGDPSVAELLTRVRRLTLEAYSQQPAPYELVLRSLKLPRHPDRNPLFQVLFAWNNTPAASPPLPGLESALLDLDPGSSRFDLSLDLSQGEDGVRGFLEYSSDLFDAASIDRMAGHLLVMLEAVAADPRQRISAIELAPAEARRRLQALARGAVRRYPVETIHGRFAAQAAATPAAVAVRGDTGELTFGELDANANRLARHLLALGAGPGQPIGLALERSPELVTGLLAILKAGAAVLPLDPDYPAERIAFTLADAGATLALTTCDLAARIGFGTTRPVCLDADRRAIGRRGGGPLAAAQSGSDLSCLLYTSGSTGQPKGVQGSHRGMMNLLHWIWETLPFGAAETACLTTSIGFVDAQLELLAPLLAGRPVVLIAHEVVADPDRLVARLTEARVGRIVLVPSLLSAILDACAAADDPLPDLRLWVSSGERLSHALAARFFRRFPKRRLVNLYGTSETSAVVTWDEVDPDEPAAQPPIGRPIANIEAEVLDAALRPLPVGVPGELCVRGAGVTGGYWRRPALTAERFLASPAPERGRLFRTGDRVRRLADGRLAYLGRQDDQVQIRGCRVEPGEVEAVIASHPRAREAAVIAIGEPGETQQLLAYVVADRAGGVSETALHHWARARLPGFMLPARLVVLERLPRTPSGKLDRHRLPRPASTGAAPAPPAEPLSPTQALLAGVWRELLGVERIAAADDFFALGGHSLLAGRMLSRIARSEQVLLSLDSVFQFSTLAGLAAEIERRRGMPAVLALPRLEAGGGDGPLPLSPAQEIMLAVERRLPGLPFFLLPYSFRLRGRLDVAALRHAVEALVRRHHALRTVFASEGDETGQRIAATWDEPFTLEVIEGRLEEQQAAVRARAKQAAWQGFDLDRAPLIRARMLQLDAQEHVLLLTLHHLVCDGWSWGVLLRDLGRLYGAPPAAGPGALPPLEVDFADVLRWQAALPQAAEGRRQLAHWRRVLLPPPPVLRLYRPRPDAEDGGLVASRLPVRLEPQIAAAMAERGRREGASLFMILLAAFKLFLSARTGETDICVAGLYANRRQRQAEEVVGLLVNTVLLRSELRGAADFSTLTARVRETVLSAYGNQELPFEVVTRSIEEEDGIEGGALCQVMFVLQEAVEGTLELPGVQVEGLGEDDRMGLPDVALTGFDLVVLLKPGALGLVGNCLYRVGRFEPEEVAELFDGYRQLLRRLAARPAAPLSDLTAPGSEVPTAGVVAAGSGFD